MKCRKCNTKAVINMRQHKLALCKGHFMEWVPQQIERAINTYKMFTPRDRILVAVSGGKDSLSLWDILCTLGYQVDGLFIGLGINEGLHYSNESLSCSKQFVRERELNLIIIDMVEEYGESIPEIASRTNRGKRKPCSVCGLIKRHILNRVAFENGYDVLVTGHNLDDEVAVLFGNTLNWAGSYLLRQGPVLEADKLGLTRKTKPLCRMYEREMAAYALLRGIKYIYEECPFSVGAKSILYKQVLNDLESRRPGAKLSFYLSFLRSKEDGLFNSEIDIGRELLHTCPSCGQPTSAPDECAFCRIIL